MTMVPAFLLINLRSVIPTNDGIVAPVDVKNGACGPINITGIPVSNDVPR